MSSAALAPKPATPTTHLQETRPSRVQARMAEHPAKIRVIPGGRLANQRHPLHARALLATTQVGTRQNTFAQIRLGMQGIPFELTRRERIFAACIGTLFAVISFAVAIL